MTTAVFTQDWPVIFNFLLTSGAAFCLYGIVCRFLTPRTGSVRRVFFFGALWVTVGMIIYVGDPINIIGAMLAFLLGICIGCEGSVMARLSLCAVFFPLIASLNAFIDVRHYQSAYVRHVLRLLVWFALWLAYRHTAPGQITLSAKLWALLDFLALMPLASTVAVVILSNENHPPALSFLILGFSAISALGLLEAVVVLSRHGQLLQERALWQMRGAYYQSLEQSMLQVRRLRHDMANHLQTMAALDDDAMRVYLNGLIHNPGMDAARKFCENQVVQSILSYKWPQIEENGIKADIKTSIPQKLPIPDLDLCIIFSNCLSNAIEACERLPREQRSLSLRARVDKGLLMLCVENRMSGTLTMKGGLPRTTKADTVNHGIGLSSIREITQRYHGSLTVSQRGDQFILLLALPV